MIESKHEQSPAEVASHYNELDRFYREIWGNHVHHGLWLTGRESIREATENLIRIAFAEIPLQRGMQLCDIGCGYGETARFLAREFGVEVVGYTVSSAQYEFARTLSTDGNNPRFVLRDWLANNVPAATFDVAYSIESSEHMPDIRKFFAEVTRTLKPGGRFMVCTWLSRESPASWELKTMLEPICSEGRMRMGTETEYRALIEEAGLRIDDFNDFSDKVARTWTLCMTGFAKKLATRKDYWAFLLNDAARNREFALTIGRIRAAYALGSMRYGIFTATKR